MDRGRGGHHTGCRERLETTGHVAAGLSEPLGFSELPVLQAIHVGTAQRWLTTLVGDLHQPLHWPPAEVCR